jgi:hypothetical protein
MDKCVSFTPPVVSSANASLLRAVGFVPSGDQKDMPVISELSALESAIHMFSQSGGEPPLPCTFIFVGVVGVRDALCSFYEMFHFVNDLAVDAARYFRHAKGTTWIRS